ncbi:Trk system potassium transporter TrkA [Treponema sp.]
MKVVIVGAGMVGSQLARHLIQEKNEVSLVERDTDTARHASNRLDCMVLHDEGNSLATLEEAGIAKADALICVTESDEVNMITCGLAASRYPNLLKIARVRNDEYAKLGSLDERLLGIDRFVHPDVEAARAVLSAVEHGALGDVLAFGNNDYELGAVDLDADSPLAGQNLRRFRELVGGECLVTLIERGGESLIPSGTTTLLDGDRIHTLAREKELRRIFELAGRPMKSLRKIGIVGGGRVGSLIAEGLLSRTEKRRSAFSSLIRLLKPRSFRRVTLIERDYALCKELSARFPDALVLNEDISDEGFVAEEGIEDMDLIITATEDQELNMIAALYLKSRGVDRAVALVSGSGYAAIARRLGIDVVVPMKSVVVDSILSHLMGSGVRGVHRVGDGSVEILEIELGEQISILGTRLENFHLTAGALVMLVTRGNDAFIPVGDYVFTAHDHIVLIIKKGGEAEVERLFGQPS